MKLLAQYIPAVIINGLAYLFVSKMYEKKYKSFNFAFFGGAIGLMLSCMVSDIIGIILAYI